MSLRKYFRKEVEAKKLNRNKIIIVDECSLNTSGQNISKAIKISNCMKEAQKNKQADFMLLAIPNEVLEKHALEIVNNRGNMILLAGNAVYSPDVRLTNFTDKLIIAVQWIRSEAPNPLSKVEEEANRIFGEQNQGVLIN